MLMATSGFLWRSVVEEFVDSWHRKRVGNDLAPAKLSHLQLLFPKQRCLFRFQCQNLLLLLPNLHHLHLHLHLSHLHLPHKRLRAQLQRSTSAAALDLDTPFFSLPVSERVIASQARASTLTATTGFLSRDVLEEVKGSWHREQTGSSLARVEPHLLLPHPLLETLVLSLTGDL